jgi:hypothetical protein
MSAVITENISETTASNEAVFIGRGRPSLMSVEQEAVFTALGLFTDSTPRRSKMNVFYRHRALGILSEGDYKWLFDEEKVMADGGGKHWKPTILTELGRIENDDDLRAVASELCERKPATRDAVLMVRTFRTGGLPAGDSIQLANEIVQIVNRYRHSHAGVTKQDVVDALEAVRASVDKSLSD